MTALWLVARYEYWRSVRQRSFLFFALGMPLFFIAVALIPIGIELARAEPTVGYVDQSGLLDEPVMPDAEESEAQLQAFASEEAGRAALDAEEIASLWIIPDDYLTGGRVRAIAAGEPSGRQERAVRELLRATLLRDAPTAVAARLREPVRFIYFSLDTGQRVRQGAELVLALLIPFGLALAFSISLAFSSGFLAQAITEEKENRLLEILATSIPVWSLLGGKIIGLGAVALTQVLFWGAGLLIAMFVFFLRGDLPEGLPVPWELLGWALLFFLLAYTLFATLLVGIGALMGEAREAQQLSGALGIVGIIPIWFVAPILQEPAGLVARVLTFFPLTAPTLVPLRMALGRISLAEVLLSLVVLALSVVLAIWVVSAMFRAAMLRYGARLSINEVLGAMGRQR